MSTHTRTAVVTGGFGVLGAAVGRHFELAGWRVALLDRAPAAERHKADSCLAIGDVDLTDAAATARAVTRVVDEFGGIDALVNVAGGFRWQLLAEGDLATWDLMYAMNLRTAVVVSQAALPHLKTSGAGCIVNIGAGAAAGRAAAGMAAYAAAKAGVHKLTESLADELKDQGITVNAVLPGIIDTPQNRADMPTADFSRWVAPADIAQVVLFLASASARSVTGALVPVTGRG
jgi:NAD(P)-dependent dehydrogenase (short-subunit alcohol dehydrogenase family)